MNLAWFISGAVCLFFVICQLNRVLDCQVSVLPAHDSAVNIDPRKKRGKIMQSLFAYFNWVIKGTFAVTIKYKCFRRFYDWNQQVCKGTGRRFYA